MSKPREFWINPMFSPHRVVDKKEEYCFKVIEKSAADKLAEVLELYADPDWCVEHYRYDQIYSFAQQALKDYRDEE